MEHIDKNFNILYSWYKRQRKTIITKEKDDDGIPIAYETNRFTNKEIAGKIGISERTLYRYKKKYPKRNTKAKIRTDKQLSRAKRKWRLKEKSIESNFKQQITTEIKRAKRQKLDVSHRENIFVMECLCEIDDKIHSPGRKKGSFIHWFHITASSKIDDHAVIHRGIKKHNKNWPGHILEYLHIKNKKAVLR